MTRDEAAAFVADAQARQQTNRRQRYSRGSKLRRYRGQLIRLQEAGASYRQMAAWLAKVKRLKADPSTIRHFLLRHPPTPAIQETTDGTIPEARQA